MHATPQSLRRCLACDAQSARTFGVDISEAQNIIHRDRVVVGVDGRHECQRLQVSFSLGPIDAAALLGVWIWALWSPATRTARTIAALITITTGYVLLSALPGVVGSVIARAGWLGAAFFLLMLHSDWFLNTSAKDAEFDDALWETQQLLTMAARKRLAGEIDRNAFAREVSDAVPAFERLEPPDKEWAALLEDTVAELRTWLAAQEGVSDEPPLRISELRDRHLRLRNSRESFWR